MSAKPVLQVMLRVLAKPGILDVVRKMLKMFILVLCTESLCRSVFGLCRSAFLPGEDLQHLSHPFPSSPAHSCCSLTLPWPHRSGALLGIQLDQSAPRQPPQNIRLAGLKFQVLSLQASLSLPPALPFMPGSRLPSRKEFAVEDVGAGPMAVMLNLLQSKEAGLAKTCYLHGMNRYGLFLAAQASGASTPPSGAWPH